MGVDALQPSARRPCPTLLLALGFGSATWGQRSRTARRPMSMPGLSVRPTAPATPQAP